MRRVARRCPVRRRMAPSDAPVRKSTPGDREQHAEDRRAGRAEAERDDALEAVADRPPWLSPSVSSSPTTATPRPSRNGPHVDERAARDDQRAERHEDQRRQVRGRARRPPSTASATGPPLKPEPEDGGEEDAERRRAPSPTSSGWWWRRATLVFLRAALLDPARASSGTSCGAASCAPWRGLRAAAPPSCWIERRGGCRCGLVPRPTVDGLRSARSRPCHPEVRRRLVRQELGVEAVAERAVQHQHLPEAVGLARRPRTPGPTTRARRAGCRGRARRSRRRTACDSAANPYGPSSRVPVAVVGARDERDPADRRSRGRAPRPPARARSFESARHGVTTTAGAAQEPERDARAPVDRHLGRAGDRRAERDAERRQALLLERAYARVGELGIARPLVEVLRVDELVWVLGERRRAHDRRSARRRASRAASRGSPPRAARRRSGARARPSRAASARPAARRPGCRAARSRRRRSSSERADALDDQLGEPRRRRCRRRPSRSARRSARGRASRRSSGPSSVRRCSRPR